MDRLPDRKELGPRVAEIELMAVLLPPEAGPLRLAGAWKMDSKDPRFGGISALAIDGAQLIALTDSGAIVRFPKPSGRSVAAVIRELPDGPGNPRYKRSRDTEALARDPAGRGWWVAFENWDQVWLFDPQFRRALTRIDLGRGRWHRNGGIEGLAPAGRSVLAFPESGGTVVDLVGNVPREINIGAARGRIADAAALPGGKPAVIRRSLGPIGFKNSLAFIARSRAGYRFVGQVQLPVGRLDNVEALAAERLPSGATRLWMMTDDNYHAPLRTLLLAYDLPPARPAD